MTRLLSALKQECIQKPGGEPANQKTSLWSVVQYASKKGWGNEISRLTIKNNNLSYCKSPTFCLCAYFNQTLLNKFNYRRTIAGIYLLMHKIV